MKKRYVQAMNARRRNLDTSDVYSGCTSSMPTMVPLNSHARFSAPLAAPMSSRIGRIT